MPHMANLPWISFYILISMVLMLFWSKENFNFSSSMKQLQTLKITNKNLSWPW